MSSAKLVGEIDEAFAKGDNLRGLDLLRRHAQSNPTDSACWHRLANIEEQLGDWDKAGAAHHHCIEAAPGNPLAYLYAGHWLQQSEHFDAAAAAYSLAQDIDPACLELWRLNTTAQQTALRSRQANSHLRRFMSDQHRALFEKDQKSSRIARAKWIRTHDLPLMHQSSKLAPALFFIPDLDQKPWFERDEFDWPELIETKAKVIKQELDAALRESPERLGIRPYLAENTQIKGKIAGLVGSSNWSAIDLYRDGELNESAAPLFPRTLELIASLPTYGMDERPFEVFFSMLQPGCSIDEHYGLSNHSLTCHIGLDVPDHCYLEVAGERRNWGQGEILAFDDSYLHSAHNQGQERRIVLIFSIWHPSLSGLERLEVQQAFAARQEWMTARREKLDQLIAARNVD